MLWLQWAYGNSCYCAFCLSVHGLWYGPIGRRYNFIYINNPVFRALSSEVKLVGPRPSLSIRRWRQPPQSSHQAAGVEDEKVHKSNIPDSRVSATPLPCLSLIAFTILRYEQIAIAAAFTQSPRLRKDCDTRTTWSAKLWRRRHSSAGSRTTIPYLGLMGKWKRQI